MPLSASFGIGRMGNPDLGLTPRTMDALSLEALPAYGRGDWSVGAHLDYRFQGQLTPITSASGTNMKGQAYLIGLGVRREFGPSLFAEGSLDVIGCYDFGKNTSNEQDDRLTGPLGLRFKAGYAFLPRVPRLTFDADLQFVTFRNIWIAGTNLAARTEQIMVAVGVTYRLGGGSGDDSGTAAPAVLAPAPVPPPQIETATAMPAADPEPATPEIAFASDSSELGGDAKLALAPVLKTLRDEPRATLAVEGHADSTGTDAINGPLSRGRAAAVKNYLVGEGVAPGRIKTRGFGSARPIADNASEAGRARNRRVEIRFLGAK